MAVSMPNQIKGTVKAIKAPGSVMAEVHVETATGTIVAVVVETAIATLGLKEGTPVTAIFRASDVSLMTE